MSSLDVQAPLTQRSSQQSRSAVHSASQISQHAQKQATQEETQPQAQHTAPLASSPLEDASCSEAMSAHTANAEACSQSEPRQLCSLETHSTAVDVEEPQQHSTEASF